ncbi:MAG: pyridoxal 5'-phosphate synthase glutaminase subunit PdxT [Chloroflexi bacterium]|nr:pyridoxal 5'-phosphate synthase glutaminase subunit PdxT [Chloroflexota bacterium]
MRIGILALQGAFVEHLGILERLGAEPVLVRLPVELEGLDGLIIPGGESTTMIRLMLEYELLQPLKDRAEASLPVMGVCAGMILLAKRVADSPLQSLGLMDMTVRRNAFGSQVDSFEADLDIPALGETPFHGVFIRAPVIEAANSTVELLARLDDGRAVAARQGRLLAAAFHPELGSDLRLHRYFLDMASGGPPVA